MKVIGKSISDKKKVCFLVSKPLQFLISQSILGQLDKNEEYTLLVVDGFSDSLGFSYRVRECELGWSEIEWFPSKKHAFRFIEKCNFSKVFIDSDVGFVNLISAFRVKCKKFKTKIFVYEEGVGSYRNDLYRGFRKAILNFLGAGTNFGGCIFTSGIYLNDPRRYLKKFPSYYRKCRKIKISVHETIEASVSKYIYIFNVVNLFLSPYSESSTKDCSVYFTSWNIDYCVIEELLEFENDKYIKLHPHLKDKKVNFKGSEKIHYLPSQVPAEIVVMLLRNKYRKISVYHHDSSLILYIPASETIKYINI